MTPSPKFWVVCTELMSTLKRMNTPQNFTEHSVLALLISWRTLKQSWIHCFLNIKEMSDCLLSSTILKCQITVFDRTTDLSIKLPAQLSFAKHGVLSTSRTFTLFTAVCRNWVITLARLDFGILLHRSLNTVSNWSSLTQPPSTNWIIVSTRSTNWYAL